MRATLQLDTIKIMLKDQHGVPDTVIDSLDNIYRLAYKEGYDEGKSDEKADQADRENEAS